MPKQKVSFWKYILIALSVLAYLKLGYYINRKDFWELIGTFAVLFACYGFFLRQKFSLKYLIGLGIGFRLLFLLSVPNLSDDYFRFLWDGILSLNGINPFMELPKYYMQEGNQVEGLNQYLFEHLNSPEYFTIYPPVCQFVFMVSALGAHKIWLSTLLMRLFIFASEIGTFFLLKNILSRLGKTPSHLGIYALNPLIIVELTGNLHFEALMIFFLALAFYLLLENKKHLSAIAFGFAVCSKLLPLMFLPFFFSRLGKNKTIVYCLIVGITSLVLFAPFLSVTMILHISESIDLYFQRFEFNASLFYLIRWLSWQVIDFDVVEYVGPALSLIVMYLIIKRATQPHKTWKHFFESMLLAITCYFFCATIIHPWYLSTLVFFAVFLPYRFPVLWSGLILLTYTTYQTNSYIESPLFITIEYLAVFTLIYLETKKENVTFKL